MELQEVFNSRFKYWTQGYMSGKIQRNWVQGRKIDVDVDGTLVGGIQ